MTPEREAYFRHCAFQMDMEDIIEALDAARAERDELRGKVAELRLALTQAAETAQLDGEGKTGFAAMPYTTAIMLFGHIDELGRELGLWEE